MPIILIAIALIITAYFFYSGYYKQPPHLRNRWLTTRALWALAIILGIAALTGRFHVIGALTSPIVPILWQLYTRLNPAQPTEAVETETSDKDANEAETQMTRRRALMILGLDEGATKEEILAAHRELIAKCHPDRGGSSYLAAEINAAKEFLMQD